MCGTQSLLEVTKRRRHGKLVITNLLSKSHNQRKLGDAKF
jgi:hypothetical protein